MRPSASAAPRRTHQWSSRRRSPSRYRRACPRTEIGQHVYQRSPYQPVIVGQGFDQLRNRGDADRYQGLSRVKRRRVGSVRIGGSLVLDVLDCLCRLISQ